MKHVIRILLGALLALGLAGISAAPPADAATTNIGCPSFSTLQTAVSAAVSGDVLQFSCAAATTIGFAGTITIAKSVTLDGSISPGAVTLDGGLTQQLFVVNAGIAFNLTSLTLYRGSAPVNGGAIDNEGGSVTITGSTLSTNAAFSSSGGAIYNSGTVAITNSTLSTNFAKFSGGAIYNVGTATIANSTLSGNEISVFGGGGGAIDNLGTLTITGSTLSNNAATDGAAGAILNESGATATISDSTFSTNDGYNSGAISNGGTLTVSASTFSTNNGYNSGAISNGGTLTISASTFSANYTNGGSGGGAILNNGWMSITSSTLSGNTTGGSGGAIRNAGTLSITSSSITSNASALGGAIDNLGTLTITTSDISFNTGFAGFFAAGGAIDNEFGGAVNITRTTLSGNSVTNGGAIYNNGTVNITTSTLANNSADLAGGAIQNFGTLSISSSTLARNAVTSTTGEGGAAISLSSGTVSIGGSIIANNSAPVLGNCTYFGGSLTDLGYNLTDSQGSCGLTGSTDLTNTDPLLNAFANNGGPTLTMALQATSPAINKIPTSDSTLCPTSGTDQRGQPRPDGGESYCDIGAYELQDPATPTLTTQASETGNGVVGTAVLSDTATLSGGYQVAGGSPAPTLTFSLFAPNGSIVYTEAQTVTGTGNYTTTGTGTGSDVATQVGTYHWDVIYSGNAFNNSVGHFGQNDTNEQLKTSNDADLGLTNVPADITILTSELGPRGAVVSYSTPTVTDESGDTSTTSVSCTPASGSTFAIGTTKVTCTATDSDDTNSPVSRSFNVTILDDTPPTLSLPGTITVNATSSQGAAVTYTVTATDPDNATNQLTIDCSPASGSTFPNGTTTVTCTATDPSGNSSSGQFHIIVNDTDLSLTNMPANVTTTVTSAQGAKVTYTSPTVVDEDTSLPPVSCSPASGSTFAIGSTTVTCTATDSDDTNSPVKKTFTVTVRYGVQLVYRPPMIGNVGSTVPVKIELINGTGQNLSSSSIGVNALCVVVQGAKDCSGTPAISYGSGSPFTFMSSLDTGAGYQLNVKTAGLTAGMTYQLLFRAAGEDSGSYHADANAAFTLTK
jgi:hypothetical protein